MASRRERRRMNAKGKIVAIAHASSGLGEATARLLSAMGVGGMLGAWRAVRIWLPADEEELAHLEAVQ